MPTGRSVRSDGPSSSRSAMPSEVTLYELVLPADSDTEVRELALLPLPIVDVAGFGWPRRDELGFGLFGIPGETLLDTVNLKNFEKWVQKETDRRTEVLHRAAAGLHDMLADVVQQLAKLRPDGYDGQRDARTLPGSIAHRDRGNHQRRRDAGVENEATGGKESEEPP